MESYATSQGVPAVFWGGSVYRRENDFNVNGSTVLEVDIVVPESVPARD